MSNLRKILLNNIPTQLLVLLIVSTWVIISQHGEINRDGVLYLSEAQLVLNQDWQQVLSLSRWPFFGILIAFFHQLTGITLLYTAHLINLLMFLLANFFFFKTIKLLSHNKTPVIYGTLTILTAIPLMDDYLEMVLRDHGLWAGFMMGAYWFLRFIREPNWKSGVLWQFGFTFGFLFRPEAAAFIVLLPIFVLYIFFHNQPWLRLCQSIIFTISVVVLMLLVISFSSLDMFSIFSLRMDDIFKRPIIFLDQLFRPLPITSNNSYLNHLLHDFAFIFKFTFLLLVATYKWIAGLGLFHFILASITLYRVSLDRLHLKALITLFAISLTVVLVNLFVVYVLTSRYYLMNWWLVYILAAIGLHKLITYWSSLKSNHLLIRQACLISLIIIYFLNVIIDKSSISPEKQAAQWLQQQSLDLSQVYINDSRTAFYARNMLTIADHNNTLKNHYFPFLLIRYNDTKGRIKKLPGYEAKQYFPSIEKPRLIFYIKTKYD